MASHGRVQVNPEHLRDGNGTLHRAMELWSCRNGAVAYNQWQSVYFTLLREHGYVDEYWAERGAAAGDHPSERQTRIRALWNVIQTELYGVDHAAAGLLASRARDEAEEADRELQNATANGAVSYTHLRAHET